MKTKVLFAIRYIFDNTINDPKWGYDCGTNRHVGEFAAIDLDSGGYPYPVGKDNPTRYMFVDSDQAYEYASKFRYLEVVEVAISWN